MRLRRKLYTNSLLENISELNEPENITQIYKLRKKLAKDLLANKGSGYSEKGRRSLINEERSAISNSIRRINKGEEPIEVISTVKNYPTLNKTCDASKEMLTEQDYDLISQVLQKELNKRK